MAQKTCFSHIGFFSQLTNQGASWAKRALNSVSCRYLWQATRCRIPLIAESS